MRNTSVTVVIPSFNEEMFIYRCLSSVVNIDYPKDSIRIVLADNGSTDDTIKIAKQFPVEIKSVPKKSIAHTRNSGSFSVRTDLIAFLDSDCVVAQDWLKNAVSHFMENIKVVAVGSYPKVIEHESNNLQKYWSRICQGELKIRKVDWLPSANLILRTEVFMELGGFNEELITCEDADLGYRLGRKGVIISDPTVTVYHLREPKTIIEFFKKEFWHSAGNYAGAFNHGIRLSELPSLTFPLVFGLGMVGFLSSFSLGYRYILIFLCFMLMPVCIYTFKSFRYVKNIVYLFKIYFVYFSARFFSSAFYAYNLIFK